MRYYRSRSNRKSSGNKRKILFRVLFVIAAAIVITVITLLIGNHLKDKVEAANEATTDTHVSTGLQSERHLEESAIYSDYSPTVFGASVIISDYMTGGEGENERSITADVRTLSSHFDTLSINLMSDDGELIYESEAMCALSRIPYKGDGEAAALIADALAEAKNNNMRTCAVILPMISETTISGAAAVDSALITELGEMGFDEVLFDLTDSFGDELTYDSASRVRTYVHECASLTSDACKLGVALSANVYLNSANAKQIQLIANAASFIAIKFDLEEEYITTDIYNKVSDAVTSLLGNFSVYNMRVIVDSRFDIISAAVYSACKEHGVTNVSFSTFILPEALGYTDTPDEDGEDADSDNPEEGGTVANPYATTADNPSIGAPAPDEIPEPDENGEDGENGDIRPWY